MKRKVQNLLFVVVAATAIWSCKDDDDDKKLIKAYTYGDERKEIKTAVWEDNTGGQAEGGGYSFYFYPTVESASAEENPNEYVWIDIPNEMMGEKFTLTAEQLYDWGWWIEYEIKDQEFYVSGFGAEGDMDNVTGGTMLATKTGENTFKIELVVNFDTEKTLTLNYTGEMTPYEDAGGRVVRPINPNR